jgi:hypothetical protein
VKEAETRNESRKASKKQPFREQEEGREEKIKMVLSKTGYKKANWM